MSKFEIEDRLARLGIDLSTPTPAGAQYVPYVISGELLVVSGQLALSNGKLVETGRLGVDLDTLAGSRAARQCAINVLAQVRAALGDLSTVRQCLRVVGYVACNDAFTEHAKVVDGASALFTDVLGPAGQHARASLGCISLPRNSPVEIEAMFSIAR